VSAPIATVSRRGSSVSLHNALDLRVAFRRREDAEAYLNGWKNEDGAMAALRFALRRCERGAPLASMSDEDVIRAVAVQIVSGNLVLTESAPPVPVAVSFPADSQTSSSAVSAAAAALIAKLPTAAAPKLVVPTLPALLNPQIEGAKVLPEVMQTLAQLEETMSKVDLATVSLEPTPSGVPEISEKLKGASDSITGTLEGL
jgi:hypothetical protein